MGIGGRRGRGGDELGEKAFEDGDVDTLLAFDIAEEFYETGLRDDNFRVWRSGKSNGNVEEILPDAVGIAFEDGGTFEGEESFLDVFLRVGRRRRRLLFTIVVFCKGIIRWVIIVR